MSLKQVLFLVCLLVNVPGVVSILNGKQVDPPVKYPLVVNADLYIAMLVSPNVAIRVAHCCYNRLLVGVHNEVSLN